MASTRSRPTSARNLIFQDVINEGEGSKDTTPNVAKRNNLFARHVRTNTENVPNA